MSQEKLVMFQCTDIGSDFHVGDGTIILGPYKDVFKENHEGEIAEIPESIAKIGVEQKRGKII
jgi:hypothetical protein